MKNKLKTISVGLTMAGCVMFTSSYAESNESSSETLLLKVEEEKSWYKENFIEADAKTLMGRANEISVALGEQNPVDSQGLSALVFDNQLVIPADCDYSKIIEDKKEEILNHMETALNSCKPNVRAVQCELTVLFRSYRQAAFVQAIGLAAQKACKASKKGRQFNPGSLCDTNDGTSCQEVKRLFFSF